MLGRMSLGAAVALLVTAGFAPLSADDSAPKWKVWSYNPSNRALSGSVPGPVNGGVATFPFTVDPNTALLITDHGSYKGSLLGDLTGKTVGATVSAAGASFTYSGQGTAQNPCPGPATVRLFFQTRSPGPFSETDYWWANPVSLPLDTLANPTAMFNPLDGIFWSDYYGHFGSDPRYAAAFQEALKNVTSIGLSFGGGCFFENGVGAPTGGSFTLWSFTVN